MSVLDGVGVIEICMVVRKRAGLAATGRAPFLSLHMVVTVCGYVGSSERIRRHSQFFGLEALFNAQ